ncbi:hypothetical protein BKA03_002741 [Demequina lutea]|uniref:Uncharacterized protein n=1 Tax=Demequina lutea TaxID=431489 RepID=A0A7Y9ZC07_9MICO|nr:hypothetical protein [Demequina lutea]
MHSDDVGIGSNTGESAELDDEVRRRRSLVALAAA